MNADRYYRGWPWRGSGRQHFAYLRRVLEGSPDADARLRAWEALLQTREPELLQYAYAHAELAGSGKWRDGYLRFVGYERTEAGLRKLYTDPVYHIFFPMDHPFPEQARLGGWRDLARRHHPTWQLGDRPALSMRFGGTSEGVCARCGAGLSHLITLEPVPAGLAPTGLSRLELATCPSCLGWAEPRLFYKHDSDGRPKHTAYRGPLAAQQFLSEPFLPVEVRVAPAPPRWR